MDRVSLFEIFLYPILMTYIAICKPSKSPENFNVGMENVSVSSGVSTSTFVKSKGIFFWFLIKDRRAVSRLVFSEFKQT